MKINKFREFQYSGFFYGSGIRSNTEISGWILKIFIACIVSIILGNLTNTPDILTLVFVTLLCLQPTVLGGIRIGLQQIISATICSLLTIFLLKFLHPVLAVSFSMVLISLIIIKSNKEYLFPIAYFSVLYIGTLGKNNPEFFFTQRITHLFIGIPVAAILNYFFGIYDYKNKLLKRIINIRFIVFEKSSELLKALSSRDK
ncbi:hypothetical protein KA977_14175, partial [Candidatus Dependentiae bacterium]|nr:hypothetical protein [Candidatus Dependentiae bacterium]